MLWQLWDIIHPSEFSKHFLKIVLQIHAVLGALKQALLGNLCTTLASMPPILLTFEE